MTPEQRDAVSLSQLWRALRDLWNASTNHCVCMRWQKRMWVEMRKLDRSDVLLSAFGQNADDFMCLADELSWRFPCGLAVARLDQEKCWVFANGEDPHEAFVKSAISWLRHTRNKTLGLVLKMDDSSELQMAILDVQHDVPENEATMRFREQEVMAAIRFLLQHPRESRHAPDADMFDTLSD